MAITYRTATLQNVVDQTVAYMGATWSDLDTDTQANVVTFVNKRVKKAYRRYRWPDLLKHEQRFFEMGKWFSASYPANSVVWYAPDEKYYENTSGGASSNTPGAHADWEEKATPDQVIPFDQSTYDTGTTAADEVFFGVRDDPVKYNYQTPLNLNLRANDHDVITGVQALTVHGSDLNHVYLYFYEAPTTYSTGSMNATMPYVISEYVAEAVYGDILKMRKQIAAARAQVSDADQTLAESYETEIIRKNQQNSNDPATRMLGNTLSGIA